MVVCLGALDISRSSGTHMDSYQSLTEPVEGDLQQECNQCGQTKGGSCEESLIPYFTVLPRNQVLEIETLD